MLTLHTQDQVSSLLLAPAIAPAYACCRTCSNKKKRLKQIKKMGHRGLLDGDAEDLFSLGMA
jgi:hypothetical protein